MTPSKPNPIVRLLPSLTDVAFLLPLILLFVGLQGVRTMLGDGDTGWHVRIGECILAHGQVPHQDMFSFTKSGEPFFAWEWLWDVSMAWVHMHWGLGGVVLASVLVISTASALLFRLVYRRCGNALVAIALTALAAAGASIHWLARPHLVTMLFMVVFLTILERGRGQNTGDRRQETGDGRQNTGDRRQETGDRTNKRLLWLLPVLTIPWTNLHGGFFVGIILIGAYAGGELLGALMARGRAERIESARAAAVYLLAAAGCAAASLVNPYFYQLHTHIWGYLRDPFQMKYIMEFQGTNFQYSSTIFLEAMLLLGIGAAVWHGRRKRFTEVLLIAGWGHLSLVSARNIPIYMIAAAPIVALPATEWLRALSLAPIAGWMRTACQTVEEIGTEIAPLERMWRVHLLPAAVMALLALGMSSPLAGPKLKPEYNPKAYPEAALAELTRPGQRTFTHDEWGDYLIYKLSPQGTKVFVDGRSDFYGAKFDLAYLDVMSVKYDWQQTLARYGVDTILLPVDAPLAGAVKESSRWRVVYDDGRAIVFRLAGETPGRREQFSTSKTGGIGGRDLHITAVTTIRVNPEDHVSQNNRGANP
jgi:hypothetical protein